MRGLLLRWIAGFLAVLVAASLLPSYIGFETFTGVAIFAAILSLLNTLVKPILTLLTAPISCLTLGLFITIINAFLFWLASQLTAGHAVSVNGPVGAFLGALMVSFVSLIVARLT